MRPEIALDLALDGIAVLSRAPAGPDKGKWYREGVVRLDAPDMGPRLRNLRARCAERHGEAFTSILVIPDSQLLFTSLERDDRDPRETIRAQLSGRTPYDVADLAFDFVPRGDRLQVAVVALETLKEAEGFAVEFGFRPVALVATPREAAFRGLADFGVTGIARDLTGGARVTLDLGDGFEIVPAPPAAALVATHETRPPGAGVAPDAPRSFADFVAAPTAKGMSAETLPTPSLPTPPRPAVPPVAPSAPPRARPAPPMRSVPPTPPAVRGDADPPPTSTLRDDRAAAGPSTSPDKPLERAAPVPIAVPTFSSRRKPVALETSPEPAVRTPRILRPGASADGPEPPTAERGADAAPRMPDGPEAAARPRPVPDARPRVPPAPAGVGAGQRPHFVPRPSPGKRGLAGIAAKLGAARATPPPRPAPIPSEMAAGGALSEAEALALPGIARSRAAPAPRRSGLRLGLYLTLSLLGVLAAIALWALLAGPDGQPVDNAAPAPLPTSAVLTPPPSDRAGLGSDLDGAAAPVAIASGPLLPPPGPDVALLLPDSRDVVPADRPGSELVSAPLPLPDASPEELAEAAEVDPALTPAPDPAVVADGGTALESFVTDGRFDAAPGLADPPDLLDGSEIYLASIDPVVIDGDAVALPRVALPTDAFSPQTLPAPAGTAFPTGQDGLVVATDAGALAPGGYRVVAGRPAVMPVPRRDTAAAVPADAPATETAEETAARAELRRIRPIARPDDAEERVERVAFNGLSRTELTRFRPRARPAEIEAQGLAAAARAEAVQGAVQEERSAAAQAAASAALASLVRQPDAEAADPASGPASRYALARSERPNVRPRAVEQDAARIVTARQQAASAPAAPAQAVTSQPAARQADSGRQTVRSAGGSVTRAATESNAISLREMNLIGVYGSPSNRRALIRMANGRYVKVEVGDRLDRGRVVAIGESEVVYQRGGRNVALRMPST